MTDWLLVHSSLLGPASWPRVARVLPDATVPDLRPALAADDIVAAQVRLTVTDVATSSVCLAGHSGAGPLLPAVAAGLVERGITVRASVFVDAGLPQPGRTWLETLPGPMEEQLGALVEDGMLPPWPSWFPPGAIDELVPDPVLRDELDADCPPIPWRVFTDPLPEADETLLGRCAYVRLSAAYDDDLHGASERGWARAEYDSHHLAPLTDAESVAEALGTAGHSL